MSFATYLPVAVLDTILGRLALLFLTGAGGDLVAARLAASQMLAAYDPVTPDQLRLAAEIISFSFHALEALGQSADPDMSLNQKLRLRGSAVSLSRESHKSQRKLDQLQKASGEAPSSQPVEVAAPAAEPVRPAIDKAIALIEAARDSMNVSQHRPAGLQQRLMARQITNNLKKNQALHAAPATAAPAA